MAYFRKRPVVIEAIQWTGDNLVDIMTLSGDHDRMPDDRSIRPTTNGPDEALYVMTKEGGINASKGDYIIKGIAGEIYPCKPDIFEASYDEVITSARESGRATQASAPYVPSALDMQAATLRAMNVATDFLDRFGIEDHRRSSMRGARQALASAVEAAILTELVARSEPRECPNCEGARFIEIDAHSNEAKCGICDGRGTVPVRPTTQGESDAAPRT